MPRARPWEDAWPAELSSIQASHTRESSVPGWGRFSRARKKPLPAPACRKCWVCSSSPFSLPQTELSTHADLKETHLGGTSNIHQRPFCQQKLQRRPHMDLLKASLRPSLLCQGVCGYQGDGPAVGRQDSGHWVSSNSDCRRRGHRTHKAVSGEWRQGRRQGLYQSLEKNLRDRTCTCVLSVTEPRHWGAMFAVAG